MQQLITKADEVTIWKNLGEDISEVVLCWDVHNVAYVLVAKCLNPFLTAVDVFELGVLSRSVCEDASCAVVYLEGEWIWKFHSELLCGVGYGHDVHCSIAGCEDFDCSTGDVSVGFTDERCSEGVF